MKDIIDILTRLCGVEVDVTVRGVNKFTFSFEGEDEKVVEKLPNYFEGKLVVEDYCFYDRDTDMTYIYGSFKN